MTQYEHFSRRGFLQTTALAAAQTSLAVPARIANPEFTPNTRPRKISDNLYVLEDTCNVYLIRNGRSGLLVDFGSGAMLHHLAELGVEKIDWILHTHHHRDQAQGDPLAVERNIPIAVPVNERQYFENVENFWRNRRIFELYYVRNDFFSLTANVPVAAVLRDYDTFEWKAYKLFIQPAPGHTPGSIALVTEIDGRKIAFTGDLIHSAGKVQTLYDLQYYYEEHEGVDLSAYSLSKLIELSPAMVCPAHGTEMADPVPGMQQLIAKLRDWWAFWKPWGFTLDNKPRQLTPHVVAHYQTMSCFYAIISRTGKALFLDYGGPSWNSFYAFKDAVDIYGRFRFVEHSIENLRANHGLKSVDVAIPSHMHDDHLNGFPYLAKHHGTKIWCFENFAGLLENPRGENLGCTFGAPIHVDRVIRDRETFRWEEFEFTAVHSPGHTNYQMALFATIDGVRLAFTGDAFFHDADRPFVIRHNLIYRNRVKVGDYVKSIQNVLEFQPDIICPGHGEPFMIDLDMARDFKAKVEKQDQFFRSLIAGEDTNVGLDPSPVEIYPYQSLATPGQALQFEIRARNHRRQNALLQIALVLPAGWRSDPPSLKMSVQPNEVAKAPVSIIIPRDFRASHTRLAIAADVIANDIYLGQIAEAVVDVRTIEPSPAERTDAGF
ncbi:MAG: MBL fold metallo-hydrolase [Acidobacteriaceae bacterium]|nr:MBL fold metallo-hydrolase [Acidobacteriaceae bacterium]